MRQLATIREVAALRPIKGADRIEVAQIDGWECVVKKGEFKVGEPVVYIEVDSIVPERPEFEFLRDRKFRIRTIKLRGQISQGLVLPLSVLPKNIPCRIGSDVTEILGIKKYDPQAQQEAQLLAKNKRRRNPLEKFLMRFKWYRSIAVKKSGKSAFPDWIAKTDEQRIQNMPMTFDGERDRGTKFSVTEKVDGQSATYYLKRISKHRCEFGVCSRNLRLTKPDDSSYWQIAQKHHIETVLNNLINDYKTVVLQGEICGPSIQRNKYGFDGYRFFAFNLIFPGHHCSTTEIQKYLEPFGIHTVPIVETEKTLPASIADIVDYSKGESVLKKGQQREGVVMRSANCETSFKVINPNFLLAEED